MPFRPRPISLLSACVPPFWRKVVSESVPECCLFVWWRMRIVITLCTRERPEMLRGCLKSIVSQQVPPGVAVSVVVVENHTSPSCQIMVNEIAATSGLQVTYAYEPRLGIPFARNRALALALAQEPDWIGFIDDDELAAPDWIAAFVRASKSVACDVLQGPVDYLYPEPKPSWSSLPIRKRQPTGRILRNAATSNTFMRAYIARKDGLGLKFNEKMRFTGGSDSEYFFRAAERGVRICWMDDAVVSETVPLIRMTLKWQLSRSRRVSANAIAIRWARLGLTRTLVRCIPKYSVRLIRGAIAVSLGAAARFVVPDGGKRLLVGGLHDIWSSLGALGAFFRLEPEPYRVVSAGTKSRAAAAVSWRLNGGRAASF